MDAAGVKCGVLTWLELALQDARQAMRGLTRRPGFSLTIILAGALGIGATTAIFSLIDRIFLRPLPYANQNRLVSVGMTAPADTNEFLLAPGYLALRRLSGPFEEVTSFQAGTQACDISEQNAIRQRCLRVEANFLDTFGVTPAVGRMFSRAEDVPSGPRVAMISYGLWRSRFASDANIEGRTISLDGVATAITGVLPQDFELPTLTPADILLPEQLGESEGPGRAFRAFARLAPVVSIAQARGALASYFEIALKDMPQPVRNEISLTVRSVRDRQIGDARVAAFALFAAVAAMLLIACANIANMLLARGLTRRHEMAMRAALGASGAQLAGLALTESALLGTTGGAAGCALAYALLKLFVSIAPASLPRLAQAAIDLRALVFATAISLGAGLLFGLAPALRVPREFSHSGSKATPRLRGGMRAALIAAQIGISLALLNGATLLLRSLRNIENVPLGIETERLVMARFELGKLHYSQDAARVAFFNQLERKLEALPAVSSFAISDTAPPSGGVHGRPISTIEIEGQPGSTRGAGEMVAYRYVTPGYFSALGIRLLHGRAFEERDRVPDAHSVVISKTLAKKLFPSAEPIGNEILRDGSGPWFEVIGVVADVKNNGPQDSAAPEFYLVRKPSPASGIEGQAGRAAIAIVRTAGATSIAAARLRQAIAGVDTTLPIQMETMEQRVDAITQRPRFAAILLGAFAATGTLLAVIGLFGVASFLVAQGTREIGVRIALGATRGRILLWTLTHAARWTAAGIVLGLVASVASARYLRSLLFQVAPADIGALSIAVGLLCGVSLIAAIIPARRAARLDPMETLRQE